MSKCPECDGKLKYKDYETFCSECGLIVAEDIDFGAEFMTDRDGETTRRTGPPLKWIDPQSGTYSMIGTHKEFNAWKYKQRRYPPGAHDVQKK